MGAGDLGAAQATGQSPHGAPRSSRHNQEVDRIGHRRGGESTISPSLSRVGAGFVLAMAIFGVLTLLAVVGTRSGISLDRSLLDRVLARVGGATKAAGTVVSFTTVATVLLALAVLVGIAVVRRRPAMAVGAATIVLGGSATTGLIKAVTGGHLPSGHVTAIAGLACAAVLVMTPRLRPVVFALGAVAVSAEAVSTMILGMHLPFATVAGVLMALGWTAAVVLVAPRRSWTLASRH